MAVIIPARPTEDLEQTLSFLDTPRKMTAEAPDAKGPADFRLLMQAEDKTLSPDPTAHSFKQSPSPGKSQTPQTLLRRSSPGKKDLERTPPGQIPPRTPQKAQDALRSYGADPLKRKGELLLKEEESRLKEKGLERRGDLPGFLQGAPIQAVHKGAGASLGENLLLTSEKTERTQSIDMQKGVQRSALERGEKREQGMPQGGLRDPSPHKGTLSSSELTQSSPFDRSHASRQALNTQDRSFKDLTQDQAGQVPSQAQKPASFFSHTRTPDIVTNEEAPGHPLQKGALKPASLLAPTSNTGEETRPLKAFSSQKASFSGEGTLRALSPSEQDKKGPDPLRQNLKGGTISTSAQETHAPSSSLTGKEARRFSALPQDAPVLEIKPSLVERELLEKSPSLQASKASSQKLRKQTLLATSKTVETMRSSWDKSDAKSLLGSPANPSARGESHLSLVSSQEASLEEGLLTGDLAERSAASTPFKEALASSFSGNKIARGLPSSAGPGTLEAPRFVAVSLTPPLPDKPGTLSLKLIPETLGRIDVKVRLTQDGRLDAVVRTEKTEAFELFNREAATLKQVLADAFETETQHLTLTLSDQGNSHGREHDPKHQAFGEGSSALQQAPAKAFVGHGTDLAQLFVEPQLDERRALDALA